jgi:hypothetical protein
MKAAGEKECVLNEVIVEVVVDKVSQLAGDVRACWRHTPVEARRCEEDHNARSVEPKLIKGH